MIQAGNNPPVFLATHKQRHQIIGPDLAAPVTMHAGIKGLAIGHHVGGIEVLTRLEKARAAVLQENLHLACQNKHPLRIGGAMETTDQLFKQ